VHSKKIGTVFSIGLIQRFLVRLISWLAHRCMNDEGQIIFF
jgi:hypothetical protein